MLPPNDLSYLDDEDFDPAFWDDDEDLYLDEDEVCPVCGDLMTDRWIGEEYVLSCRSCGHKIIE